LKAVTPPMQCSVAGYSRTFCASAIRLSSAQAQRHFWPAIFIDYIPQVLLCKCLVFKRYSKPHRLAKRRSLH
jgi:hypothetical protein